MIIAYPNLIVFYHNPRLGICGVEDLITDVKKGKYGYDLKDGSKLYRVDYMGDGLKAMTTYHVEIEKVTDEGLVVSDYFLKGGDRSDFLRDAGLGDGDKTFLPWKFKGADLLIQPIESLFENYKLKGIIDETTPKSNGFYRGDKWIEDERGIGYFYQHGGWRTNATKYKNNIKNFVALNEQLELDL